MLTNICSTTSMDENLYLKYGQKSFHVDEKLKKIQKFKKKKPQPCGKFKLVPNLSTKFGILKKKKVNKSLN